MDTETTVCLVVFMNLNVKDCFVENEGEKKELRLTFLYTRDRLDVVKRSFTDKY